MDAILGFLQSQIVMLGFVVGLAVKYLPALKWVPNKLIPYVNALLAVLVQIFGPAEAHAGVFGAIAHGSFLGTLVGACWTSIQSALVYEVFGRHIITAPKA